jgi:hypothetical protein
VLAAFFLWPLLLLLLLLLLCILCTWWSFQAVTICHVLTA